MLLKQLGEPLRIEGYEWLKVDLYLFEYESGEGQLTITAEPNATGDTNFTLEGNFYIPFTIGNANAPDDLVDTEDDKLGGPLHAEIKIRGLMNFESHRVGDNGSAFAFSVKFFWDDDESPGEFPGLKSIRVARRYGRDQWGDAITIYFNAITEEGIECQVDRHPA